MRLLRLVLAATLLPLGVLGWRLAQGPLDLTVAVRAVASGVLPGLRIGRLTVALDGKLLRVAVTALRAGGEGAPEAAQADLAVDAAALLRGAVLARSLSVEGLHVRAIRGADGALALQGLPSGGGAPGLTPLRTMENVVIHDAILDVTDAATGQVGHFRGLTLDARRDQAGLVTGHAAGMLAMGDVSSALTVDASGAEGSATRLHATASALNPAALARLLPALAPLGALDAALAVTADVTLTPALAVQHAAVHAESGPGRAFLPAKHGVSPAAFASLSLDADGAADALHLTALRLVLAPPSGAPPSTILLSGDAMRTAGHGAGHGTARLHLTLDRARLQDIGALWPSGVGGNARPWLVENVPTGTVHDGRFDLTLETAGSLDDVALTAAGGTMLADEVSVYWLRPVPPIEHGHVLLTLLDPDTLTLAATGARQGRLLARQAAMRIWGLSTKDQFSQIDADIAAPIADVFTLLHHPKLELLSVHPLPIPDPAGQSLTHLTIKLPLDEKVTFDAVDIHAAARLTDVRVAKLLAGLDLDHGAFTADITQNGLTLSGPARLAGIGSTLAVEMDFRDGPPHQVVQHVAVASQGDERALAAAGLKVAGVLSGTVSAKLDYAEQRDGHAVAQGSADLRAAAVATPLGWSKPAGPAASVEARAELDHGHVVAIDRLRAEGPGLSVLGRGEMVDGVPAVFHLERAVIGGTSMAGTVAFPPRAGEPVLVSLSGAQLDLSGPLSRKGAEEPQAPDVSPGRPYRLDLRFDRVMVGKAKGIGPVTLSANGDTQRVVQAHLASAGPERLDLRIEPRPGGRHLSATVGDLGLLLQGLDLGAGIDGGALTVEGDYEDRRAGSPLAGTATLGRFGVTGAAAYGKLLQGLTLYGLVDALRGPGLVFDQMTAPFTLTGGVLELRDARAFTVSLGVTAQGKVDFDHGLLDLQGTVVPAYALNTLPGLVPLVGRLFSPEPGGGVFATTFGVHGPLGNPAIGVNPLATLTPGALRGLFNLFD